MEPKKNPQHDVHRKYPAIFNFSLALSILIVISAFTWKTKAKEHPVTEKKRPNETLYSYEPIVRTKIEVPKPKITKSFDITKVIEAREEPQLGVDIEEPQLLTPMNVTIDVQVETPAEVPENDGFPFVEEMPAPEGGLDAFYSTLRTNLRYPIKAKRNHKTGKVFVEFTVGKDGQLTNFKVLKGLGYGCDEEAVRVISLTKWKPGKQRGVPVKVRMVQAIHFHLQ